MIHSFIMAGVMGFGVFFLKEAMKILKGIESPYALIALMFIWDGVTIFGFKGYTSKEELALGIMMGTLIKCYLLIRHGKTSSICSRGQTESEKKGNSC